MDELFNNMIANAWDAGLLGMYDNPLSYEMIEDSVGRACDFFHIEHPESIEPGHTTAVSLGDTNTYGDEILFFNHAQLEDMGITGQDGLDLVMTHEGTHIMLQDMDMGFSPYQEELCCDYMAGVRAGLNGMDVSELENAFAGLEHDATHPDGSFRIDAIEDGLYFAKEYMLSHDLPPTFNECLEDFKDEHMQNLVDIARLKNEVYNSECEKEHYRRLMEREPDNMDAKLHYFHSAYEHHRCVYNYEHKLGEMGLNDGDSVNNALHSRNNISFEGKDKDLSDSAKGWIKYYTDKADKAFEQEKWCYSQAEKASHRGDEKLAKDYIQQAKQWHSDAEGYLRSAKVWKG